MAEVLLHAYQKKKALSHTKDTTFEIRNVNMPCILKK